MCARLSPERFPVCFLYSMRIITFAPKLKKEMKPIKSVRFFRFCVLGAFFMGITIAGGPLNAQISERVYASDSRIDPARKGELSVEIDNLSFFKDDEYQGSFMKGYTLPGLWLQAKAVYSLSNLKLEAGVHALRFWGANKYPSMAYQDMATWKGEQYQKGFHVLPWFRAQLALSEHVDIVLGSLYGAANHRLIEPLYNPELNLTADPEMGLQVLYTSRRFDLDVWVNWESFIFREDVHQEAFTVGLSSRYKLNEPTAPFHFYVPLQLLAQHRGGEIDTIATNSVQTLTNGALGVGAVWNAGYKWLKRVNVEVDVAGYYQQKGQLWPFDKGYGVYAEASADLADFRVKAGYWRCHRFISLFGSPFYGAVSMRDEGLTFDNPSMVHVGAEYSRELAKGFSLGIDVDLYAHLPATLHGTDREGQRSGSATSFSAGIYLRVNPSFLIKKF